MFDMLCKLSPYHLDRFNMESNYKIIYATKSLLFPDWILQ